MKLLINIPKEFEQHFQADRFEDSLHRLSADAHLLAGNYEQETAKMLRNALKSAVIVQPHGRLIDADAMIASIKRQTGFLKIMGGDFATMAEVLEKGILQEIENAPTIIEAAKEGE